MDECPVCGKAGLADDAAKCPQCGADLECFQLLDALHEDAVVDAAPSEDAARRKIASDDRRANASGRGVSDQPQTRKRGNRTWWFVILILAVVWFYPEEDEPNNTSGEPVGAERSQAAKKVIGLVKGLDRRMERFENKLSGVATRQKAAQHNLEATQRQLSTVSEQLLEVERSLSVMDFKQASAANRSGNFRHCQPRDHQPLPAIAERCYGDKVFYPLLLEYNPGLGIHYEHTFGPLKVIKNRKTAQALLQQLIITMPEHTLMRYRVIPGDSWPLLSRRLFGDTGHAAHLKALNRNLPLKPGERILIPLP